MYIYIYIYICVCVYILARSPMTRWTPRRLQPGLPPAGGLTARQDFIFIISSIIIIIYLLLLSSLYVYNYVYIIIVIIIIIIIMLYASQDVDMFLRDVCGIILRRIAEMCAETDAFPPCKITNKYSGDSRRRRIRTKKTNPHGGICGAFKRDFRCF